MFLHTKNGESMKKNSDKEDTLINDILVLLKEFIVTFNKTTSTTDILSLFVNGILDKLDNKVNFTRFRGWLFRILRRIFRYKIVALVLIVLVYFIFMYNYNMIMIFIILANRIFIEIITVLLLVYLIKGLQCKLKGKK